MRVGSALPPEVAAALEMLFAHLPAHEAAERVSAARMLLQTGGFKRVGDDNRAGFEADHWRSFEETQDFPEVNDQRTLEDVLKGLRTAGLDPDNWWLLRDASAPVGVLLLAQSDDKRAAELAY